MRLVLGNLGKFFLFRLSWGRKVVEVFICLGLSFLNLYLFSFL